MIPEYQMALITSGCVPSSLLDAHIRDAVKRRQDRVHNNAPGASLWSGAMPGGGGGGGGRLAGEPGPSGGASERRRPRPPWRLCPADAIRFEKNAAQLEVVQVGAGSALACAVSLDRSPHAWHTP